MNVDGKKSLRAEFFPKAIVAINESIDRSMVLADAASQTFGYRLLALHTNELP